MNMEDACRVADEFIELDKLVKDYVVMRLQVDKKWEAVEPTIVFKKITKDPIGEYQVEVCLVDKEDDFYDQEVEFPLDHLFRDPEEVTKELAAQFRARELLQQQEQQKAQDDIAASQERYERDTYERLRLKFEQSVE